MGYEQVALIDADTEVLGSKRQALLCMGDCADPEHDNHKKVERSTGAEPKKMQLTGYDHPKLEPSKAGPV